ncbi:GNAT family N-acetyltransferase [Fusibacter tunisiensis]|uniref:GNAT superfamily acetyltransferase n=1 Tax=Fusibacter tunisiensis TaxID=1008308 RepID=A0ABS2MRI7_9FIRM|nr:GNAT family N-acetyltransferase [Fusibacter tunisiensis]MBM7562019.1 putative GNAT superfamily acetyltransferase [Fusibacter tunisiensis]
MDKIIRPATKNDMNRLLALNEESVHFLSPLDHKRLEMLVDQSEQTVVVEVDGQVEAFAIVVREGKSYDSVNYRWFLEKYDSFLYVDRVVVSVEKHGEGIGRMLYDHLFDYAKSHGFPRLTAEIDINPPNPVSLKFHETFGFKEVGKQSVYDGKKVVSLQAVELV